MHIYIYTEYICGVPSVYASLYLLYASITCILTVLYRKGYIDSVVILVWYSKQMHYFTQNLKYLSSLVYTDLTVGSIVLRVKRQQQATPSLRAYKFFFRKVKLYY
jgi:hypothetical protein